MNYHQILLGLKFFVVALAYTPMAETLSVVVHEKRNWLWGGFGKGPAPKTDLRLIIQMNGESKNYRDESRFPKVILMNPDRGSRYSANELPSL